MMKKKFQIYFTMLGLLLLTFPSMSFAQSVDFEGLGFGTGIALTWDSFGDKDRVESARVVNGIVRVEDENKPLQTNLWVTSGTGRSPSE